jgi:hypothetical protein
MAFYLENPTAGTTAVNLGSTISLGSNVGDYLEFSVRAYSGNNVGYHRLAGNTFSFRNLLLLTANEVAFRGATGNSPGFSAIDFNTNYTQPANDVDYVLRLEKIANNNFECLIDGVSVGTGATTNNFDFNCFGWLNSNTSVAFMGRFYYIEASTNGGTSVTNYWDPSATNGTGTTLEDTVGTNDGTLQNTTGTTNSWWVSYSTGITVTGATPNYNYAAIAGTIGLTGTITVTGNTPNYSYSAIAGSVDLTGTITVIGNTPNYSYTAISGTVDLTSQITITGATPNFSYAAIPGAVSLTSQITITGITPNYSYSAVSGLVDLTPQITITGATPSYSYNAISGTVEFLGTITVTGDTPNYSYSAIRATIQVGERIYLNNFVGEQAQQGVFNGIVKSSNFSGIIKQVASFNGITSKTATFVGVAK